ncbi:MAG TPA: hypothetical protein VFG51_03565 [Candidatus Saccharimonadia bacterium]|nr:hypothetical protein [Candidatus Saccharimonadia bacterium]
MVAGSTETSRPMNTLNLVLDTQELDAVRTALRESKNWNAVTDTILVTAAAVYDMRIEEPLTPHKRAEIIERMRSDPSLN